MKISEFNPSHLNEDDISKLLYYGIEDNLQNGDLIFVPGSSKAAKYRLPQAIRLYQEGRASKLLFSGGVKWPGDELTEAEMLMKKAIGYGIPSKDLFIENISLHTKENVLASMLVMDRMCGLENISNIIIVTAPFHMRRLHMTLLTYMPKWIHYSLVCSDDGATGKEQWMQDHYGRKRVLNEAGKIIDYVKKGILIDLEI
ncbi:YdcF family protein [Bacillus sp. NTK034]|uniref:YdcF family protein n=1 Tax=Bacillus sp. NTK034 TaxID=2802176 RepID=UPI001A8C4F0E|nr:YdcF family protein [Bacillus sp. NTK034]MBN8201230.1 YdcF family protein [Bacillus sp. NTK034]